MFYIILATQFSMYSFFSFNVIGVIFFFSNEC